MTSRSEFEITLKPVKIPAFGKKKGHWTNYEAVEQAGITHILVTPVLLERQIDEGFVCTDLDLYFDPDQFPDTKFGIVYGDHQFQDAVQSIMKEIFPEEEFGLPFYTEQGMQGDDYVSMEYPSTFAAKLRQTNPEFLASLHIHPAVGSLTLDA